MLKDRIREVFTPEVVGMLSQEQLKIANTIMKEYMELYGEDYLTLKRLRTILSTLQK
jgi:predicted nucleotidyltransferase